MVNLDGHIMELILLQKQGTKIKSSGTGVVTMAEDDLYYTGGTVIMDHGHGINLFKTLKSNISVGDKINQGDIIGTVGSTGRSTRSSQRF